MYFRIILFFLYMYRIKIPGILGSQYIVLPCTLGSYIGSSPTVVLLIIVLLCSRLLDRSSLCSFSRAPIQSVAFDSVSHLVSGNNVTTYSHDEDEHIIKNVYGMN